jgi:hypothetical protein
MSNEAEIAVLQGAIRRHFDDIEELQERYGTSIRPNWVGEEIGVLWAQINRIEKQIEELQNND